MARLLLRKTQAFVLRDFQIESSYKFAFIFELFTSVFPIISSYFIATMIRPSDNSALHRYGGGYFPFALIGIAMTQYLVLALGTFSTTIRRNQMAGCLEAILGTRTGAGTVVVLSSLYSFLAKIVHILIVLVVGGTFFGVSYAKANVPAALLTFVLSAIAFSALGIFSAAAILVLKKGTPIEWVFGTLFSVLGGALFPPEVMPGWLQKIAAFLPTTYSFEAMRLAILQDCSIVDLWRPLSVIAAIGVVLLPTSIACFVWAVEKGRRDGTLMSY